MTEQLPGQAARVDLHALLVRTAIEAFDDRERHRLAREQRQQEAERRRQAEQAARARWLGARRSSKYRSSKRRGNG